MFEEPFMLEAGDSIEATCHYDNSPEHQPVVEGVKWQPRDITWGPGLEDEMCVANLAMSGLTASDVGF